MVHNQNVERLWKVTATGAMCMENGECHHMTFVLHLTELTAKSHDSDVITLKEFANSQS